MLPSKQTLPKGLAIAAQSAEFWRRMAPELTISDAQPRSTISRQSDLAHKEMMALVNDGFLHLEQPGMEADFALLATVVQRIVSAGLPPAFIGVYDEAWALAGQLSEVLNVLFGGKAMMVPNFSASFSTHGDQGVPAHRRRPRQGVFADGRPKSVTVWMPLTRATARNGCVYAVPASQDRNYGKPDPARADSSLLAIRALPAEPGDVLIWTGETYHWQARTARHHDDGPLTSLTWEFQSRDIAPLEGVLVDSYPYVPFETRLGILARQMPQHTAEITGNPVWRAVQMTLANRYPLKSGGLRA
jgi:hypothetical protein